MIEMNMETITPERAAHYLKRNVDNYRKISKSKVALYAQEMKAGKWQLNGESIVFDRDGKLKNGQHRLAAVIVAGVPIQMTVVKGVEDKTNIFDVGMARSLAQISQASGAGEISTTECAVANVIVGNWGRISKAMAVDYIVEHSGELKRAFRICGAGGKSNLSRRTSCVLAALMVLRDEMKSYEVELFFKVFNSGNTVGTDGYEPSPALVARRMFEERYKARASNTKTMKEQAEIILLALRDFKAKKKRQMNYQIKDPMICIAALNKLREEDGLE